jgi:hypothetical protein
LFAINLAIRLVSIQVAGTVLIEKIDESIGIIINAVVTDFDD